MLIDRGLALINTIYELFPTTSLFLYRQHIKKNDVKVCKKHFPFEEVLTEFYSAWGIFFNSINIPTDKAALKEFEQKFLSILIEYCISTWLGNQKKNIVWAWVDQSLYFDNTITFFIEECYHKIKEYLDSFIGDLKHVCSESLKIYWTKQYADYKAHLESAKTQTPI